jgi:hypothetical protein
MTEKPACAECGDPIDPPETAVRMAQQVNGAPAGAAEADWRDGLVFHYHVGCAPGELVGVWRRVD